MRRSLICLLGIWAVLGLTQAKPMSLEEDLDKIETEINSSSGSIPQDEDNSGASILAEDEDGSSSIEDRKTRSIPDPDRVSDDNYSRCGNDFHPDHLAHEQQHHRFLRSATVAVVEKKPDNASSSSEEEQQSEKTKVKANSSGESSSSEEQEKLKVHPIEESSTVNALRRKRQVAPSSQENTASSEQLESTEIVGDADSETDVATAAETQSDKDKTSVEDYAQGCEVLEVSSKEANEATYVN